MMSLVTPSLRSIVVARPDAALLPGRLIVEREDGRIEVGQRIEIDEARADQCLAIILPPRDLAVEPPPDKHDFAILEHHLTVLDEPVAAIKIAGNPLRR